MKYLYELTTINDDDKKVIVLCKVYDKKTVYRITATSNIVIPDYVNTEYRAGHGGMYFTYRKGFMSDLVMTLAGLNPDYTIITI